MKNLPYARATSGEKALADAQKILEKYDCQSFGVMQDTEHGLTIVQFKHNGIRVSLQASWAGYAAALQRTNRGMSQEKAIKQAKISVCSVLRDWIKGQITAVQVGLMSFEEVFMPHILMKDGRRMVEKAMPLLLGHEPN